ncbi:MAG: hypothetical protein OER88_07785 [Planctomycetota bacterium]|nr:hypothetical protein [Planctomycetota bacterium]
MGVVSIGTLVASAILLPILLARMPADYFVADAPPPDSWRGHHPVLRVTLIALKNALGVVLLLAGLAMLFLPGQGLLTILMGLMLVSFPGKRHAELWLVKRGAIHRAIDWIRKRAHQPPLRLPD